MLSCCMILYCETAAGTAIKVLITAALVAAYLFLLLKRGADAPSPRLRGASATTVFRFPKSTDPSVILWDQGVLSK